MMETSCYGKYHHDLQWLQKHPILMVFLAGKSWPIDPVPGRTKRPSNARDPSPRRVPDFVFLTSAEVLDVSGAASGRVVFVKLSGCESWPLGAKVVVPRAIAGIVISMGEIAFPLEMDEHKWLCLGWKNPTYRGRCFFFANNIHHETRCFPARKRSHDWLWKIPPSIFRCMSDIENGVVPASHASFQGCFFHCKQEISTFTVLVWVGLCVFKA